jgi:predicted nucleic acid-binding protein
MVFGDTVGLLALWDKRDQWHQQAEAAYAVLAGEGASLLTTNAVMLECGNAVARKPYRRTVLETRLLLLQENRLVTPTDADWQQAWIAYDRGAADDAGIVDQISFKVMRRMRSQKYLEMIITSERRVL